MSPNCLGYCPPSCSCICTDCNAPPRTYPYQVTLIREFCQGPNCLGYCLPSGCFEPKKHATMEDCAKAELSEEVRWCVRRERGPRS